MMYSFYIWTIVVIYDIGLWIFCKNIFKKFPRKLLSSLEQAPGDYSEMFTDPQI